MSNLLAPLTVGRMRLPNRILMAPMTRSRADDEGVVGPLVATYYAQRAGAGLIVAEGMFPEPMGKGYVRTPGLADARHVRAWRAVTDAVHARGGRIVAQLMHAGRISDASLLSDRATPVAPSAVRPRGTTYTDAGPLPHATPRALTRPEIAAIVERFAAAAARAIDAGFDGVELHAGAGYLPMQFLSTGSNLRGDAYGGTTLNRTRFVVETMEAIVAAIGAERTGLKITPGMAFNDIEDADPLATHAMLLQALRPLRPAFLEMAPGPAAVELHGPLRALFDGAYLAGVGFDRDRGDAWIDAGRADAILYGQAFIANPDLVRRFAARAPLATPDAATFYAGGARGYVDYPALDAAADALPAVEGATP